MKRPIWNLFDLCPKLALRILLLVSVCATLKAQFSMAADSDSERLTKLEAAVKTLQTENAALKREVAELKGRPASKSSPDGKSYVEIAEVEKKPKPISVAVPGPESN